jgi:hypothetical protein
MRSADQHRQRTAHVWAFRPVALGVDRPPPDGLRAPAAEQQIGDEPRAALALLLRLLPQELHRGPRRCREPQDVAIGRVVGEGVFRPRDRDEPRRGRRRPTSVG